METTHQTVPQSEKKTRVDLPADLLRRAKVAAAEQDTTLKQFIAASIEANLAARGLIRHPAAESGDYQAIYGKSQQPFIK